MHCSGRKVLDNRTELEDERCSQLEAKLREAQSLLQETESRYEEVKLIGPTELSDRTHVSFLCCFVHFDVNPQLGT